MKKIIVITILFLSFLTLAVPISASGYVVSSSAQISKPIVISQSDYRVLILQDFLLSHNSPMANYADDFVCFADEYKIDWRLIPAIAGVESTFGKRIPLNSYNAYGWNNGNYYFNSWPESIEIVTRALREKYYDNGSDSIDKIARRYAPPSNTWSWKVKYFMEKIDSFPLSFTI